VSPAAAFFNFDPLTSQPSATNDPEFRPQATPIPRETVHSTGATRRARS
jgi:hypothetical protein